MDQETLQRRRAERARQRRRRHRRRRLTAVGALVTVFAVVAVTVVLATGGGHRATVASSRDIRDRQSARARDARRVRDRHHRDVRIAAHLGPPTGHPGDARVPILMYHVINPPPPGAPYPGLYVPSGEFAAQMSALAQGGWHAVTLDEVRENWLHGNQLPMNPIVITFDNGYRSQYTNALPILSRLGWAADENMQLAGLPPSQGGLTAGQVRGLVRAGWELDTQGISHADLVELDGSELAHQIDSARTRLRGRFHVPVRWFCYPSGQYDPTVAAAVRADGFVGSTTVVPGWASRADDSFSLPRLRVLGGTSPAALLAQIAAARADPPPASADETSSS